MKNPQLVALLLAVQVSQEISQILVDVADSALQLDRLPSKGENAQIEAYRAQLEERLNKAIKEALPRADSLVTKLKSLRIKNE